MYIPLMDRRKDPLHGFTVHDKAPFRADYADRKGRPWPPLIVAVVDELADHAAEDLDAGRVQGNGVSCLFDGGQEGGSVDIGADADLFRLLPQDQDPLAGGGVCIPADRETAVVHFDQTAIGVFGERWLVLIRRHGKNVHRCKGCPGHLLE